MTDAAATNITQATDNDFADQVLQSTLPTLVDYWAQWCQPCLAIAPVLESIAADYAGKIHVVKVNVEEQPQLAAKYGVRALPTLMLFKNGQVDATTVGALSRAQLVQFIDDNI